MDLFSFSFNSLVHSFCEHTALTRCQTLLEPGNTDESKSGTALEEGTHRQQGSQQPLACAMKGKDEKSAMGGRGSVKKSFTEETAFELSLER